MTRVLIGPAPLAADRGPYWQLLTEAGYDLAYPAKAVQMTEEVLLATLPGTKAVLAGSEPYTARVLDACPELRVIARAGVGFDAVDVAAATERGVAVTFTPGTNQDAVAEHCFGLMLALVKSILAQDAEIRRGGWPRRAGLPLRGRTLGLVGLGRIGKSMTTRARAFGMPVIAYEPAPDHEFVAANGITLVPLERLLAEADFVSLHLPLLPTTRKLINANTLALMKPTAFLINSARGGLVDEADLGAALASKRIAGAGLDVFDHEPLAPDHPFCTADNVVLTAHTAGVDSQSLSDMASTAARAIVAFGRGEWPAGWLVNPEVKDRFRW